MKIREIITLLTNDGWFTRSHRQGAIASSNTISSRVASQARASRLMI